MKNQYFEFWRTFLGLSLQEILLPNSVISSVGRYLEKYENKYVFLYQDLQSLKKVLMATSKNLEAYGIINSDLDNLNIDTAQNFKNLTLAFHDIDYGIDSTEQFTPNDLAPKSIDFRKLSSIDLPEVEKFKSCCSEDDVDTLDFDIETDFAFGAFLNGKLIGICRYVVIRETKVADITVVVSAEYRNQKLSAPLVSRIVESILSSGFTPKYRVQAENIASIKIAKRLGFKPMFQIFTWEVNS